MAFMVSNGNFTSVLKFFEVDYLVQYLCLFLGDIENVLALLSSNKFLHSLKKNIKICYPVKLNSIINTSYIGAFRTIIHEKLPNTQLNTDTIIFKNKFNETVTVLPTFIKQLWFGKSFNQPIDFLQSYRIVSLILGDDFNQKINCVLPSSLLYIKFGNSFNQCVQNILPNSLKIIIFGDVFDMQCDFSNFDNLQYLSLGDDYKQPIVFPKNLQGLFFEGEISLGIIPKTVNTILVTSKNAAEIIVNLNTDMELNTIYVISCHVSFRYLVENIYWVQTDVPNSRLINIFIPNCWLKCGKIAENTINKDYTNSSNTHLIKLNIHTCPRKIGYNKMIDSGTVTTYSEAKEVINYDRSLGTEFKMGKNYFLDLIYKIHDIRY